MVSIVADEKTTERLKNFRPYKHELIIMNMIHFGRSMTVEQFDFLLKEMMFLGNTIEWMEMDKERLKNEIKRLREENEKLRDKIRKK